MILGLRPITRRRYNAPTWSDGMASRPSPVISGILASVDVAPRSRWALDASGHRTVRVVEIVSYTDLREASAAHLADRVVIDGRTYEVQSVTRMDPFEGEPSPHYETTATEIRGADVGAA